MAQITLNSVDSKKVWEEFLEQHSEANFLQSWYWGEFHQVISNKVHRTGFYRNGNLVGVMLSIIEDAKRGRYLTVPAGPIIDWQDLNQIRAFVDEIRKIATQEKCVFIRVRPQLQSDNFSKKVFAQYGFINAPMHLHAELTSQLNVTRSEEELLAGMRKNTRYDTRKAIELGIKVTHTDDPSALKEFYDLQVETAQRQNFVPFSYAFLQEQFRVYSQAGKVLLYTAKLEDILLAQAFIIFYGEEAAYHYGASTQDGRKYPGAYLIQWEAIKEAKRRGMGSGPRRPKRSSILRGLGFQKRFWWARRRVLACSRPDY